MPSQKPGCPPCDRDAEELPIARSEAALLAVTARLAASEEEIVEAHAGKIWADSRRGEGTTVSFTLPTFADLAEEIL